MKDAVDPDEVSQAAKYVPALEIIFGPDYDVVPVLVLTAARDLFRFVPLPGTEAEIVVCSGDILSTPLTNIWDFWNSGEVKPWNRRADGIFSFNIF